MENNEISVNGSGVVVNGSDAVITKAGSYYLEGTLTDGSIEVAASDSSDVYVILDGAHITNQDGPALLLSSGNCRVTSRTGTKNELADAAASTLAAAVYAEVPVTFTGTGSLSIDGNYRYGIYAEKGVTVNEGTIKIESDQDGISAESLNANGGQITIVAGGDGVYTSKDLIVNGADLVALSSTADSAGGILADGDFVIKSGMVFATGADTDSPHGDNKLAYVKADVDAVDGDSISVNVKNTSVSLVKCELDLLGTGKIEDVLFSSADVSEGVYYDVKVAGVTKATVAAKK